MLTTADGITERFLSKVIQSECWEWTAYRDRDGYGKFFTHKRNGYAVKEYAHRWAYARWVGDIPEGMEIDHLCRNRGCVNPGHLEAVTKRENNLRSLSVSANRARQTHCLRGHPLSGSNLRVTKDNRRRCRECDRAARQAKRVPKGNFNARKTECIHGHALAGENLIMVSANKRACRICRLAASARWARKAKES